MVDVSKEMISVEYVYHSSATSGLKVLHPRESSHNHSWVYATKDKVISALFLSGTGGDFTCAVGRDDTTGIPYLCERFEGAIDLRCKGVRGSIYRLPGGTFLEGQTHWNEEVVSPVEVVPVAEIVIPDARQYLLELANLNELIIKEHPERIDGIPDDDEDLVFRAAIWFKRYGQEILDGVGKYQPQLMERVIEAIESDKYQDLYD